MEIQRLQVLTIEILKISKINPGYMRNMLTSKANVTVRSNDVAFKYHKTTSHGDKSLIWNQPPSNLEHPKFGTSCRL